MWDREWEQCEISKNRIWMNITLFLYFNNNFLSFLSFLFFLTDHPIISSVCCVFVNVCNTHTYTYSYICIVTNTCFFYDAIIARFFMYRYFVKQQNSSKHTGKTSTTEQHKSSTKMETQWVIKKQRKALGNYVLCYLLLLLLLPMLLCQCLFL